MTTFYCVRHGKTEFNQSKVIQGGLVDSPLLKEGQEAAGLVGDFLKDVPFKKVLVSPQKRAQDTANLLLAHYPTPVKIETVDDLREMEFGSWDGYPEHNFQHEPEYHHLMHRPHLYDPTAFEGETFPEMIARGRQVFIDYAKEHPGDNILIVSHGLFLKTILKTFQGTPIADIRKGDPLDNTSVTTVSSSENGEKLTIEKWNDTSFIPEQITTL